MRHAKWYWLCGATIALSSALFGLSGHALAQSIGPVQEQELIDARNSIEMARKAQVDRYAAIQFKQAQEILLRVDSARQAKDADEFSHLARLARAYAELSVAISELGVETDKLASTNDSLQKAKAEIERMSQQK